MLSMQITILLVAQTGCRISYYPISRNAVAWFVGPVARPGGNPARDFVGIAFAASMLARS